PCIGALSVPLSGLGLLLGFVGLVVALTRRGRGIGFSIAGVGVSGLALCVGLFWNALYRNYLEDSKLKRARIDIETISKELSNYKAVVGHYPNNLQDLIQPWQLGDGSTRPPTLRPQNLMDPWDRPYQSSTPNPGPNNAMYQIPDVWSDGPDGGQRIGNWGPVQ